MLVLQIIQKYWKSDLEIIIMTTFGLFGNEDKNKIIFGDLL